MSFNDLSTKHFGGIENNTKLVIANHKNVILWRVCQSPVMSSRLLGYKLPYPRQLQQESCLQDEQR
eukprot:3471252-Amphidinium_carterae.2